MGEVCTRSRRSWLKSARTSHSLGPSRDRPAGAEKASGLITLMVASLPHPFAAGR